MRAGRTSLLCAQIACLNRQPCVPSCHRLFLLFTSQAWARDRIEGRRRRRNLSLIVTSPQTYGHPSQTWAKQATWASVLLCMTPQPPNPTSARCRQKVSASAKIGVVSE